MKIQMVRKQAVIGLFALVVAVGAMASAPRSASADTSGYVSGVSFWDANKNGKWDAGEQSIYGWYKITDGGSWFVCGAAGLGGTFSVPVSMGTYYIVPVAPKGYRATTPVLKTTVIPGATSEMNNVGFVKDDTAMGDSCDQYNPAKTYKPSIVEIAATNGNFNTLVAAVKAAGLVDVLSGPGPFTVFAPTDAAFAKLPSGTIAKLLANPSTLAKVLTYHVVAGNVMAADVVKLTSAKTVEGEDVTVTVKDGKVWINNAQILITDIPASNGVIHVIDSVIVPPSAPASAYLPNIVEMAGANGNFNTLVAAVKAAGLVDTLSGPGPFTVFAPTDAAFAKLPAGTIAALLKDPQTLAKILTYHVVAGKVMAADVVKLTSATTVEGQDVKITVKDGKVWINDAQVVITDIGVSNGVVHVIDSVILPPSK